MRWLENRVVRGVAGILVMWVILAVAIGYVSDFRRASRVDKSKPAAVSEEQTSTPSPDGDGEEGGDESEVEESAADKAAKTPDTLKVKIDGLNLRSGPEQEAKSLEGLDKGDELTVIGESDGWYEVKSADGTQGWVSSNPSYTEIERR